MPRQPNTTLETVSDYISDGRTLLLDSIYPYRYDDPSLLVALNIALLEGRRLRPDLFVFTCGDDVPAFFENDGAVVPMEKQFRLAFLHGMVGHALERDQEDVQAQASVTFLTFMANVLTGKKLITPAAPGQ